MITPAYDPDGHDIGARLAWLDDHGWKRCFKCGLWNLDSTCSRCREIIELEGERAD